MDNSLQGCKTASKESTYQRSPETGMAWPRVRLGDCIGDASADLHPFQSREKTQAISRRTCINAFLKWIGNNENKVI